MSAVGAAIAWRRHFMLSIQLVRISLRANKKTKHTEHHVRIPMCADPMRSDMGDTVPPI